jgi:hypothetical protein
MYCSRKGLWDNGILLYHITNILHTGIQRHDRNIVDRYNNNKTPVYALYIIINPLCLLRSPVLRFHPFHPMSVLSKTPMPTLSSRRTTLLRQCMWFETCERQMQYFRVCLRGTYFGKVVPCRLYSRIRVHFANQLSIC